MTPPVRLLAPMSTPSRGIHLAPYAPDAPLEAFVHRVEQAFARSLQQAQLLGYSAALQEQYKDKLQRGDICMLPSFTHTLPSGRETGSFLAMDVGGSNFRVALVELAGRDSRPRIVRRDDHAITCTERALVGRPFFDWMAGRIEVTLQSYGHDVPCGLSAGLAWSFPLRQTSSRDAALMQMGKHFRAADGLLGQNLTDLISEACAERVCCIFGFLLLRPWLADTMAESRHSHRHHCQ